MKKCKKIKKYFRGQKRALRTLAKGNVYEKRRYLLGKTRDFCEEGREVVSRNMHYMTRKLQLFLKQILPVLEKC